MNKKILLSVLLGVGCLWLAFRGIDLSQFKATLTGLDWKYLCAALPFLLLTFLFRAFRMRLILAPISSLTLYDIFGVNAVGFMAINLFPLRLGELTRPLMLKKRHGIAFSSGLAVVAVERLFDGLSAALILLIGFLGLPSSQITIPFLNVTPQFIEIIAILIFVPLIVLLMGAVLFKEQTLHILEKVFRIAPTSFRKPMLDGVSKFFEGLQVLPNVGVSFMLLIYSLFVWGAVVLMYQMILVAFGLHLNATAPFVVLGIAMVGISLPAAPGFVGTFQLFVQAGLALYGISKEVGLAYSIVVQGVNFIYIVLMGLFFLPKMSGNLTSLYESASHESVQT